MEDIEGSGFIDDIFQWPIGRMNIFDVWYYICKYYLTSVTDQRNLLVASSQFFGPLLEEQKCSILFGPVLHVLHKHKYLDISKTELLNYRSLSKWCRETLDRSLELENPCFQNLDGMDHDICDPEHVCWLDKSWRCEVKQRNQDIAMQMRDVDHIDVSFQIPWGYLTFPGLKVFDREIEHQNFSLILSKVGTKIRHFKYIVSSYVFQWNMIYESLSEFLGQMPNLRTLEITDERCQGSCQGLSECNILLESQPLPNLDHLTMLKVSHFPAFIVDALLQRYANKLESLSIITEETRGYPGEEICLQRTDLLSGATKLSQLAIGYMSTKDCVHRWFDGNINAFMTLKCLSVCIKQRWEELSSTVFMELCRILHENLISFRRLRTLNLFIRGDRSYGGSHRWGRPKFICCCIRLSLPSVKRLWIHVSDTYFTSLDFILGLDNLEELVVNLDESFPDQLYRTEQIKFVEFWNRMEESNVWDLMPKLKTITVRRKEWSRPVECYNFTRPTLYARPSLFFDGF